MPRPTIITCAGSWPDPEPCTIDTRSSLGASLRLIRLYSGTYSIVSGLASAMPSSISGTNCLGSLTNFFTLPPSSRRCLLVPRLADLLGDDAERRRACVDRTHAALARVGRPPALGDEVLRVLRRLLGGRRRGREGLAAVGAALQLLLQRVRQRDERVE